MIISAQKFLRIGDRRKVFRILLPAVALLVVSGVFFAFPKPGPTEDIAAYAGPLITDDTTLVNRTGDFNIPTAPLGEELVYEVTGGSGIITAGNGVKTTLVLNGTNRTGAVSSQLRILDGADVTLYLAEGTTNSFKTTGTCAADNIGAGIYVAVGGTLTINGTDGRLDVTSAANCAGIGGIMKTVAAGTITLSANVRPIAAGTIIVNGGVLDIAPGAGGAGIGGGTNSKATHIIINGGNIRTRTTTGSGIGGGTTSPSGRITINGGTIDNETTGGASGTGGGSAHTVSFVSPTNIGGQDHWDVTTVNGGNITTKTTGGGSGMGSGSSSYCGLINIYDGYIRGEGSSSAAGIGNGVSAQGGEINIYGGTIVTNNRTFPANGTSGVGGGSGGFTKINIVGGNVFSVSSDYFYGTVSNAKVRINSDSFPRNTAAHGSRPVYSVGVKLQEDNSSGAVIPYSTISIDIPEWNGVVNLGTQAAPNNQTTHGEPYTYTAITDADGMAYLWLPAGTYNSFLYNPENGTYIDSQIVVNTPADPSEYPLSTNVSNMFVPSSGKMAVLDETVKTKLYNGTDTTSLTLDIDHFIGGTCPTKGIAGVKWYRESVNSPAGTIYNFDTRYGLATTGNKGIGGPSEVFALDTTPGNYGDDEHHYSMPITANGRYWIQVHYISANLCMDVYHVERIDVKNIFTPVTVYERGIVSATGEWLYGVDGAYIPINLGSTTGIPYDLDGINAVTGKGDYDTFSITDDLYPGWHGSVSTGTTSLPLPQTVTLNPSFTTGTTPPFRDADSYHYTLYFVDPGKQMPVVVFPALARLVEGDQLSAATLSGQSASVPGTFAFAHPAYTPGVEESGDRVEMIFTPTDTTTYTVVYGSVPITVLGTRIIYTPSTWTTGNVSARITFNDPSMVLTDSSYVPGGSDTYIFTNNGSYTFYFIDDELNPGQKTANVSWIDRMAPTFSVTGNPTSWQNTNVTLTVSGAADAGAGLHATPYSFDDGVTWQAGSAASFSSNQTVNIKVRDTLGNVSSAETVVIDKIDKVAPTFSVTGNPTSWQNTNVTLSIDSAADSGSGLHATPYSFDDGVSWQSGSTYTFSSNQTVEIKVRDALGNESTTTTIVIDKIDKTAPTFSISGNPTSWQNTNVTLSVDSATDSQSGLHASAYSFDDGVTWQSGNTYTFTSNQTVKVKVRDALGNISAAENVTIDKIDKTAPTFSVSGNPTSWQNADVTLSVDSASDSHSGLHASAYSFDDGTTWQAGNTYTFSSNQTVEIKVRDALGNVSAATSVTIDKIDKTAPTFTVTGNPSAWQNTDVTLTINDATDAQSGLHATPYSFDDGVTWQAESTATFTSNQTVKVKVRDTLGNISAAENVTIDKIDKTAPTFTVTGNPSAWQNTDVTLTITGATDAQSGLHATAYSFDDGVTWQAGNTAIFDANQTVKIKVRDALGNTSSTETVVISKITREAPAFTVSGNPASWQNTDVTLSINDVVDSGAGLHATPYSFDDGATWQAGNTYTFSSNQTVKIKVRDSLGNTSDAETVIISKIDKTAPTFSVTGNPSAWQNTSVTLTVEDAEDSQSGLHTTAYSFDDGATWQAGDTYTFDSNQTVKIKVRDALGNISTAEIVVIDKIDKAAPTFIVSGNPSTWQNTNITLSVDTATDSSAGLHATPYSFDDGATWQAGNTATFTANQTVKIKVRDALGNTSSAETVTIDKIDKTAPTFSVNGNPTSWQNTDAVLSITGATDAQSGLHATPYSFDDGVSWQAGNTASFSTNQTVEVRVRDALGNVSTAISVTIDKIDKAAPTFTVSGTPTTWQTSATLTVESAADSQSGLHASAYSFDDGTTWQVANTATFTTNQTIKVKVRDSLGNVSLAETVVIDKIDRTAPTFSVSGNPVALQNADVTLSIDSASDSGVGLHATPYSFDDGTTWQAANTAIFDSNQTVNIKVRDALGNVSTAENVTIDKIDRDLAEAMSIIGNTSIQLNSTSMSGSYTLTIAGSYEGTINFTATDTATSAGIPGATFSDGGTCVFAATDFDPIAGTTSCTITLNLPAGLTPTKYVRVVASTTPASIPLPSANTVTAITANNYTLSPSTGQVVSVGDVITFTLEPNAVMTSSFGITTSGISTLSATTVGFVTSNYSLVNSDNVSKTFTVTATNPGKETITVTSPLGNKTVEIITLANKIGITGPDRIKQGTNETFTVTINGPYEGTATISHFLPDGTPTGTPAPEIILSTHTCSFTFGDYDDVTNTTSCTFTVDVPLAYHSSWLNLAVEAPGLDDDPTIALTADDYDFTSGAVTTTTGTPITFTITPNSVFHGSFSLDDGGYEGVFGPSAMVFNDADWPYNTLEQGIPVGLDFTYTPKKPGTIIITVCNAELGCKDITIVATGEDLTLIAPSTGWFDSPASAAIAEGCGLALLGSAIVAASIFIRKRRTRFPRH